MGDFDFYIGTWDVANRRLKERHVGCDEWDEFPAVSVAHGFFAGAGNFDEITFPTRGFSGATVRTFDPARQEWSIWWMNSRDGQITPPVVGRFENGVGTFYGDDLDGDIKVRVRFIWSEITATSARWEQAFSTDAGETWEINWIMTSQRRVE